MAISRMEKILIVTHHSEATELLETLQHHGICQILNAEKAMVTKDWPELHVAAKKPKETEDLVGRLSRSIDFLKKHSIAKTSMLDALAPRAVIDDTKYKQVISNRETLGVLEQTEKCCETIEELESELEHATILLGTLLPWQNLATPLEELNSLEQTSCITGLISDKLFEDVKRKADELGVILETVGKTDHLYACLIVCLKEKTVDAQKMVRAADFENVSFESMTGTVAELIAPQREKILKISNQLAAEKEKAAKLSQQTTELGILYDHNNNLASREQTQAAVPATEQTIILEGWTRHRDYKRLEEIVAKFSASSVSTIETAEDEEVPVEIENRNFLRPFEVVTRLYGMPQYFEVDPTAFLAPFFALFFALCLTDAGYGLIIIGLCAFLIKKMQGDKKFMWMLLGCSVLTIGAGAMTGGWFGDGAQRLSSAFGWTWLAEARESMMWFDPMVEPMIFFNLSLILGYIHIMVGLIIAFVHNLSGKRFVVAICDQLTWLVMLNAIVLKLFGTEFGLSPESAAIFGKIAMVPAAAIVIFSQRHGPWAGRIAMGCYNLFSTIFYMGDVLSYLRLMALGMVTGGLAMAFNVMATTVSEKGTVTGYIMMVVILIGGHVFNTLISGLSAFVHTIRLQFVEFFPKFLEGGGIQFKPLEKEYKHIYISEK